MPSSACKKKTASARDAEAAFAEARRIESLISTWQEDSELSRINRGEVLRPSPEVFSLLQDAMSIAAETEGAFDPLVRPLIDAWRFFVVSRGPPGSTLFPYTTLFR